MPDSKFILFSKIFVSSLITVVASIAMAVMRHYGFDVIISPEMQSNLTVLVIAWIAWLRTRPTVPLHIKGKANG